MTAYLTRILLCCQLHRKTTSGRCNWDIQLTQLGKEETAFQTRLSNISTLPQHILVCYINVDCNIFLVIFKLVECDCLTLPCTFVVGWFGAHWKIVRMHEWLMMTAYSSDLGGKALMALSCCLVSLFLAIVLSHFNAGLVVTNTVVRDSKTACLLICWVIIWGIIHHCGLILNNCTFIVFYFSFCFCIFLFGH